MLPSRLQCQPSAAQPKNAITVINCNEKKRRKNFSALEEQENFLVNKFCSANKRCAACTTMDGILIESYEVVLAVWRGKRGRLMDDVKWNDDGKNENFDDNPRPCSASTIHSS